MKSDMVTATGNFPLPNHLSRAIYPSATGARGTGVGLTNLVTTLVCAANRNAQRGGGGRRREPPDRRSRGQKKQYQSTPAQ